MGRALTKGLLRLRPATAMAILPTLMDTPLMDTAITRGRLRSTTSMLLPSPTTHMAASLTLTGPPRVFTRGLLRLSPAMAMPTTVTPMDTRPRMAMGTTRGLLRLSPATAMLTMVTTMDTSPRTAMGTTRGLLRLSPAMAMLITVTAMDTSPLIAMGTTRGRPRPAMAMDMATSPPTAMVTAMATTKLFQEKY